MKNIEITPKIAKKIKAAAGPDADMDQFAVFESIFLNTKAVSKRGSIFNGATATPSLLQGMAKLVQDGKFIPLHLVHVQAGALPVGRVIDADTFRDGKELRGLFYLAKTDPEAVELINKLNAGVIEEVSVSIVSSQMKCSKCGWDYRGADATFMNLYEQTCGNGHTIGDKGTHLILDGEVEHWNELSLVSLGAASGAKIQHRAKALMAEADYQKLAATGVDPCAYIYLGATSVAEDKEHFPMDTTALALELTKANATVMVKDGEIASLKAAAELSAKQVADLTASVADLTAKLTASQAEIANLKVTDANAMKAANDAALTLLQDQVKSARVVLGKTGDLPVTLSACVEELQGIGMDLSKIFAAGGKATPTGGNSEKDTVRANFGAFTTRPSK